MRRLAFGEIFSAYGISVHRPDLAVEAPAVERTADAVAVHLATRADVRTQMGTVGVDQPSLAGLGPVQHEVLAERIEALELPRSERPGLVHDEPSVRDREGKALLTGPFPTNTETTALVSELLGIRRHGADDVDRCRTVVAVSHFVFLLRYPSMSGSSSNKRSSRSVTASY